MPESGFSIELSADYEAVDHGDNEMLQNVLEEVEVVIAQEGTGIACLLSR